jgi:hypothetical protein
MDLVVASADARLCNDPNEFDSGHPTAVAAVWGFFNCVYSLRAVLTVTVPEKSCMEAALFLSPSK